MAISSGCPDVWSLAAFSSKLAFIGPSCRVPAPSALSFSSISASSTELRRWECEKRYQREQGRVWHESKDGQLSKYSPCHCRGKEQCAVDRCSSGEADRGYCMHGDALGKLAATFGNHVALSMSILGLPVQWRAGQSLICRQMVADTIPLPYLLCTKFLSS